MTTYNVGFSRSAAAIALGLLAVSAFFISNAQAFIGSFNATETTANVAASSIPAITFAGGTDAVSGTIPAITFAGGVTEVKASRTLTVATIPADNEFIVIGNCAVLFANATSTDSDCDDNVASIDTAAATAATLAASLRGLTGVTAPGHGTLTLTGATVEAIFTTTNTELSATGISFTDGTTADITSTADTTGVVPAAASVTITVPAGLANAAADQSITIDDVVIPLGNTAQTADQIAAIIAGTSFASGTNYGVGAYTVTNPSGANVTFTKNVTGAAGNGAVTIGDASYTSAPAAAATVTVTVPAGLVANAGDQSVTIDGVVIALGTVAKTADQVAATIAAADFSAKDYTVTNPSGADLTFTKNATGSAGNGALTVQDAAYGTTAQVVDFTPSSPTDGETFRATINGTDYEYTVVGSVTVQNVVETLQPIMDADPNVACSEDDTKLTCTASVAGTAFTFNAEVDDITAPVISQVNPVQSPTNDTTPSYTFTTSEAGAIGYGGSCSGATTAAATSSNTISFNALGEGTYNDCQLTVTDLYGNVSNILAVNTFTIDTTAPTVSVSSLTAGGNYNAGDVISVSLNFTEAVWSSHTLTVTFNSGGSCTTSGILSNETTKTCAYTVQAGENAANLSVTGIAVDSGGTITDAASNAANLTPTSNLAAGITVDTAAPVISSVSFNPTTGTLAIGDVLVMTIDADQAGYTQGTITVNGVAVAGFTDNADTTYTVQYTVTSGNSDIANSAEIPVSVELTDAAMNTNAAFTTAPASGLTPAIDANAPAAPSVPDMTAGTDSGSSSSDDATNDTTPTFTGTAEVGSTVTLVVDGTPSADYVVASTGSWSITSSALSEGGHSISAYATDVAGNVGTASAGLSVLIDTTSPTVSETVPVTTPTNDSTPAYTFTSDEAGAITYGGSCSSGTGSASAGANAISFNTLGEGTYSDCTVKVTDAAGNVSNTVSVNTPSGFTIDLTNPTVAVTSTTADGYYNMGDVIDLTLTFSEPVTSTHALTVSLDSGGTCSILALTNATTAACTYTVQIGNNSSDLTVSGISVDSGGTLKDAAGNSANLTPTSNLAATSNIIIDTIEPTITEITQVPTPRNDTTPTYVFSSNEAGTINVGGSCSATTTSAVVGTNALTFNALADGGYTCPISVTDAAGNQSIVINNLAVFVIDTTAPTVAVTSSTLDGYYNESDPIDVTLTFSEPMFSGDTNHDIVVTMDTGGSCTIPAVGGGQSFSCSYQVGAGENSSDLTVSSITIANSGTLRDAAGNDANLTPTSNMADTEDIVVDTTAPVLTLSGSNPQDLTVGGTYTESGATADDGSAVVIDSSALNTSAVGIYAVDYDATDLAGNAAATVTRTVNVNADPAAASVTLSLTTNPDTTVSGTFPGVTQTSSSGTPMSLTLPAGTVVTGPSGWSGVFNFPSATTTFTSPTLQSGYNLISSVGAETGDMTYPLVLSRAARLVFPGKIGQYAGWSQGGSFTQITTLCVADDQTTADAMAAGADCYMNVGLDLVIWTKHLTTFISYYQLPQTSTSSGGGGGGNGPIAVSAPSASGGEVLGAEDEKLGYYFTRDLRIGMSGEDVTALQNILISLGHMTGEATGYFGAKTSAAVKLYQKENGIPQTGTVGPLTRASLNAGASQTSTGTLTPSGTPALSSTQAQAILGLLQSFGADQSVIDSVKKALGY